MTNAAAIDEDSDYFEKTQDNFSDTSIDRVCFRFVGWEERNRMIQKEAI